MPHTVDYAKPAAESQNVNSHHRAQATHYVSVEAEFGSGLNQALNRGQRADFSYLLAMLSDNVIEHSSFSDDRKVEVSSLWTPPFAVGSKVPLQSTSTEFNQSPTALFTNSRTHWCLQQALQPAGLHPVNDAKHIPAHVVANCAHYVQHRLSGATKPDDSVARTEILDVIDHYRGVERAVA